MERIHKPTQTDVDLFRDTPLRLLGYANELGESFRGYGLADAISKAAYRHRLHKDTQISSFSKNILTADAFIETAIWQTLASVLIPGFTINRIVWFANRMVAGHQNLPAKFVRWFPTVLGLASIFVIFQPIDSMVHYGMDNYYKPTARSLLHRALDPYNLPEVEEDEIYHDFDPASVEEFHHHGLRHAGPKKSNPEI